uniref:Ras-GEF domain-containing protein n=1 Tax=Heterorhabditis bacteriophora TaxID=37862 RepID=A0A1I7WCI6_HETBA
MSIIPNACTVHNALIWAGAVSRRAQLGIRGDLALKIFFLDVLVHAKDLIRDPGLEAAHIRLTLHARALVKTEKCTVYHYISSKSDGLACSEDNTDMTLGEAKEVSSSNRVIAINEIKDRVVPALFRNPSSLPEFTTIYLLQAYVIHNAVVEISCKAIILFYIFHNTICVVSLLVHHWLYYLTFPFYPVIKLGSDTPDLLLAVGINDYDETELDELDKILSENYYKNDYDPHLLEDVEAANRTIIRTSGFIKAFINPIYIIKGSTKRFAPSEQEKIMLNETFSEKFPNIQLTYSKLRRYQYKMLINVKIFQIQSVF